ncbi:nSTAND3 domain-containing NTPase [Paenibacillus kobensis]|uniref:nSTAND3 domain-containing NTPase n=1 Tax=Paenibacillus kobensis TaxID=59841 RepID=UPI000FDCD3EF|nr:restriction endonuclease [Paenibacillus kobensis]
MRTYNLSELDWKAFERLCIATLQLTRNKKVQSFSGAVDGGRDGYYEELKGNYDRGNLHKEKFVFQFKHTSDERKSITYSLVEKEIAKIKEMVINHQINNYTLITNYNLTDDNEKKIKRNIEKEVGMITVEIYGKKWLDDMINLHTELRRYVPRLYFHSAFSIILDEKIIEQSKAILQSKSWRSNIINFVETPAFFEALNKIEKDRFIFLKGESMSGKSAMAQYLCYELLMRHPKYQLIKKNLKEFEQQFDPNDCERIYFIDDVFGVHSTDTNFIHSLSEDTFLFVQMAIEQGAFFIFTSRDYILNEAKKISSIVRYKRLYPEIFDESNFLQVTKFNDKQRKEILYNHIKYGDLPKVAKSQMKPFLNEISMHPDFNPELARRLGNYSFNKNVDTSKSTLEHFFKHHNKYLQDLFSELHKEYKAAIVFALLHESYITSRINTEEISGIVLKEYKIEDENILIEALKKIDGSFVRQEVINDRIVWLPHHPSMREALLPLLKDSTEIFITLADFDVLSREASCLTPEGVYISGDYWEKFTEKLFGSFWETQKEIKSIDDYYILKKDELSHFFAYKVSESYLVWLHREKTDINWSEYTNSFFDQLSDVPSFDLAYKLERLGLLSDELKANVIARIFDIATRKFDITFLKEGSVKNLLGEVNFEVLLKEYSDNGLEKAEDLIIQIIEDAENSTNYENNLNTDIEQVFENIKMLENYLVEKGLLDDNWEIELDNLIEETESKKYDLEEENQNKCDEIIDVFDDAFYEMKGEADPKKSLVIFMNALNEVEDMYNLEYTQIISLLIEQYKERGSSELPYLLKVLNLNSEDFFNDVDE